MARILPFYVTESQLVGALLREEARAQKVLYDRYAPRMLAICLRYVVNKSDAEEVLIDGFMRVFEKIGQYRQDGSFEGWMRRIMVTESLMFLRRSKAWRQELTLDNVVEESANDWIADELSTQELLRLVAQLPDGYRSVFNLYAIEGYSHAEIAELLNISEGTSKSQLSRARALLQQGVMKLEQERKQPTYGHQTAFR